MKWISVAAAPMLSALIASAGHAAIVYSENFDIDHSANWTTNSSHALPAVNEVNYFFDYNSVGIPSAPGSGGSTRGLLLKANKSGNSSAGISASPVGQSFSGDYVVKAQVWTQYHGPLGTGGAGSTQMATFGIGTAGTTPQYFNGTDDSLWFAYTGEAGAFEDYRAYSTAANGTIGYAGTSTVFASPPGTDGRRTNGHTSAYYSQFGGEAAPAAQVALFSGQTGTTPAGAAGFAWRDVEVTKLGNNVTWELDGLLIATIDLTTVTLSGGNIFFGHSDINSGSSTAATAPSLLFTLVDNITLDVIPEPSSIALLGLSVLGLAVARRRCAI